MDCICTIDDIERLCGGETNAPGLTPLINITCIDEVDAIPAPTTGSLQVSTNITMRTAVTGPPAIPAGRFRQWPITMKENAFTSEKDENGLWNTEIKGFVEKLKASTSHTMSGINGNNYIALVEDFNGEANRIVGDKVNGCEVMVKETTSPKNGYEVTIKWASKNPPLWYTGAIVN
jgi:hypothetical protein